MSRRTTIFLLMAFLCLGMSLVPAVATSSEDAAGTRVAATDPAEQGRRLFQSKGCFTCHHHDEIVSATDSLEIGPDLTHYAGTDEFLGQWLSDPTMVNPDTEMPNLELDAWEIDYLIAFLLAK